MIPTDLKDFHQAFWNTAAHNFDLTSNTGCGMYTEAFVKFAQMNGYPKVGHLKKNPSQTQYNGHANDAILYLDPNEAGLNQAVDLIGSAESTNPNDPPHVNFGVDIPRYTSDFWLKEPSGSTQPAPKIVPWVAYNEQGFDQLKRQLKYDYSRRPQGADFDVTVWAARVFHSTFMGPNGTPLGLDSAIKKHRSEWCAALTIPVDDHWET